jgi:hypothetical protein
MLTDRLLVAQQSIKKNAIDKKVRCLHMSACDCQVREGRTEVLEGRDLDAELESAHMEEYQFQCYVNALQVRLVCL